MAPDRAPRRPSHEVRDWAVLMKKGGRTMQTAFHRQLVEELAQLATQAAVADGWVGHKKISSIVTPRNRADCRRVGLMDLNTAILEHALDRRWLAEKKHYWVPGPLAQDVMPPEKSSH